MKFCSKRICSYTGLNGVNTTSHYVTEDDIIKFHGKEFFNQFKVFSSSIKTNKFDLNDGYYYDDYKFIAYRTELFISAT